MNDDNLTKPNPNSNPNPTPNPIPGNNPTNPTQPTPPSQAAQQPTTPIQNNQPNSANQTAFSTSALQETATNAPLTQKLSNSSPVAPLNAGHVITPGTPPANTPTPSTKKSSKSKLLLIIFAIILVIGGAGAAAFVYYNSTTDDQSNKSSVNEDKSTDQNSSDQNTTVDKKVEKTKIYYNLGYELASFDTVTKKSNIEFSPPTDKKIVDYSIIDGAISVIYRTDLSEDLANTYYYVADVSKKDEVVEIGTTKENSFNVAYDLKKGRLFTTYYAISGPGTTNITKTTTSYYQNNSEIVIFEYSSDKNEEDYLYVVKDYNELTDSIIMNKLGCLSCDGGSTLLSYEYDLQNSVRKDINFQPINPDRLKYSFLNSFKYSDDNSKIIIKTSNFTMSGFSQEVVIEDYEYKDGKTTPLFIFNSEDGSVAKKLDNEFVIRFLPDANSINSNYESLITYEKGELFTHTQGKIGQKLTANKFPYSSLVSILDYRNDFEISEIINNCVLISEIVSEPTLGYKTSYVCDTEDTDSQVTLIRDYPFSSTLFDSHHFQY